MELLNNDKKKLKKVLRDIEVHERKKELELAEKKHEIVGDIMRLKKKLKKIGKEPHSEIALMTATKYELQKFRKKLNKQIIGGAIEERLDRDDAIKMVDQQLDVLPLPKPPNTNQVALEARDDLADRIRDLMSEIDYVRPGMVGYYHMGGKKPKIIKCPKCDADVLVRGGKAKGPKNPKRQESGKKSEWMKYVAKVGKMPEYKGKPRSEIMKVASAMRKLE